ncbi:hypothetical protein GGI01_002022 [Coemansia sp. RSA 376]|nr:hypothetical protein GGH13_001017 [Coemansia sp. S155-1]KAJ2114569.1 hypothetical protein IW146_002996 [Coemansia sp. RSA 922]KAJ2261802.1 hypothetical protein GGI01_002022 [Coemansia sp. RSA 376]
MTDAVAGITRKTRFVDLPVGIQQFIESIEQQKQAQLQIGSSIKADETEQELKAVARTIQRLGQELQVVKMTLGGDRERVEDATAQVNFAVKHAKIASSLVAQATDNGAWGTDRLTQQQAANRKKAMLAHLSRGDSAADTTDVEALAAAGDSSAPVDDYEAVRRIKFASMDYDVTNDYYWAWLTRVESSTRVMAERLDQLERFVATNASSDEAGRPSPRAVSDVMQCQNDSFLAIAGKVAALDDDVRRLRKKLGIKEAN